MQYFPLFMNLTDKPVLVVGGGEVACRKVDSLIRAGAEVTIVSPNIEPYLQKLAENDECLWVQNFYSEELLDRKYLQVWATTDNPELNHRVYHDAKALGLLVNVVDDQPYCDFITPSMINRGRIQIAISSGGASPVLVRNIREQFEATLPQNLSLLADFGASKRTDIKQRLPSVDLRRKFWESFFNRPETEMATERTQLEDVYLNTLENKLEAQGSVTWIDYGHDVELLPIKALRIMQQAELVFFDNACPFEFVDLIRRDAERKEYRDDVDLSEGLATAKSENLRVVILVAPSSSQYNLLKSSDMHIRLGSV
ncbi:MULTISPECIES: precorrin-2 dehydrogenase/sirohydrochlorin ferrochelatase family protein [Vibrio]|uniref:precorrin-2 dehydrogenase/sirohydrochlorin ferrochelatase family protein n=1 Tax=Vibrio TaxID=662 RepID=UPI002075B479|nr:MULTISPECIES: siroheme synthase [Vibrio]USD33909.1 siroheme synthase [Vibrio sp. SCSIO 43186]USD47011.1 siroheme synthase [Vibrio sp. SCSIO 43145]USD71033.1 siroheme synthase [Vibrio sp. SCSIO 43139]USD95938.1 siroheme synthase [Vibrio coralliilyticus]